MEEITRYYSRHKGFYIKLLKKGNRRFYYVYDKNGVLIKGIKGSRIIADTKLKIDKFIEEGFK